MQEWMIAMLVISIMLIIRDMAKTILAENLPDTEGISLRHLCNIEHGKNWISIEKLIMLADALEENPVDLFAEIVKIYRSSKN